MARNDTCGFDILVQIAESELNEQIARMFHSGDRLPIAIRARFQESWSSGSFLLNLRTPVASLDHPPNQISLRFPFTATARMCATGCMSTTMFVRCF